MNGDLSDEWWERPKEFQVKTSAKDLSWKVLGIYTGWKKISVDESSERDRWWCQNVFMDHIMRKLECYGEKFEFNFGYSGKPLRGLRRKKKEGLTYSLQSCFWLLTREWTIGSQRKGRKPNYRKL